MQWSKYQLALFEAITATKDSLLVEAVAGSGKTTTLIECVNRVSFNESLLFLAFNKSIADTLQQRLCRTQARVMTLHACGFKAWRDANESSLQVDSDKSWKIFKQLNNSRLEWGSNGRLISLAKQHGLVPGGSLKLSGLWQAQAKNGKLSLEDLPAGPEPVYAVGLLGDTDENWLYLIDTYGLDESECDIEMCRRILAKSILTSTSVIDFDDMIYMPVVTSIPLQQFDTVFVDEAQDTNDIQRRLLKALVRPQGRVIAVGDVNQAIYHFRGATATAMKEIQQMFNCRVLPLSISYRCAKSVVRHSQSWVKAIEWAEGAEEGKVEATEKVNVIDIAKFRPDDVVLCRLMAPLVSLALRLIRSRIPCRVAGREIGKGLIGIINSSKIAHNCPISVFVSWLEDWARVKREKLTTAKRIAALRMLEDRLSVLDAFIAYLPAPATISDLMASITDVFDDTRPCLTLSTVHKAKGLEWPRVFVLNASELMPCPWSSNLAEERNIMYVAATRAKQELYYIHSDYVKAR